MLKRKIIVSGFSAKPEFFGGFSACRTFFGSAAYGGGLLLYYGQLCDLIVNIFGTLVTLPLQGSRDKSFEMKIRKLAQSSVGFFVVEAWGIAKMTSMGTVLFY